MKVYGPYLHKNGRMYVTIKDNGKCYSTSYARYIYQQYYNIKLNKDQTIDHIDNDFTNDAIENLQILSLKNNIQKSSKKTKMFSFYCKVCGKYDTKPYYAVMGKQYLNRNGPFCSHICDTK